MDLEITIKYFQAYRDEHNLDTYDYVSNGEVLVWLAKKFDALHKIDNGEIIRKKSLDSIDEYISNTPQEEVEALVDKYAQMGVEPKERWWVHEKHCCKTHGCKYADAGCPVVLGLTEGISTCEFHTESECNPENWDDIYSNFIENPMSHHELEQFKKFLKDYYEPPIKK